MSTEAADLKTKKQRSKRARTEKTPTETPGGNAEEAAIAATAP